jgi:endonuclease/exonuclease/phosphatase family metal-dependent hydrolase
MPVRVMTWNVWWRFGGNWRAREAGILATFEAYRPDVIGLTESWAGDGTSQPERFAGKLGMHAAFTPTALPPAPDPVEHADQTGAVVGIGLVSRWPIRATEVHELPHDQRGGAPPTALLSTLDHPRGPLHVIVSCLEWEPHFAADQVAQARALAGLATDPRLDGPLPVLVTGDMNAAVEHATIAPLTEALVDTWAAGDGDPGATSLDSRLPFAPVEAAHLIDRRIDHVFARAGRRGGSVGVLGVFLAGDRPVNGVHPSDHYAVGVDLEP